MTEQPQPSRLEGFVANPRRALWRLALPMMAGMSLHSVYMIVDMIFLGRVSSSALTALAFNMPLLFFALGVTFGLGSGVTAVVARHIGAQDKAGADNAAEHGVVLGLALSVVFTASGLLLGRPLLRALGVPPEVMDEAWGYFGILAAGYAFPVLSVFFRSILSGEGDMITPMLVQGGGTVLNIVLDPLFIFVFGWGVRGAAAATIISQAAATAVFVQLLFVKRHAYVQLRLSDFRLDPGVLGSIFKIGAPASFSFLVMAAGGAAYNLILVAFSGDAVAAYQVGARIDHVFLVPIISLATALVTVVGMFSGARRLDLVRQVMAYSMARGVAISLIIGATFYVLAPAIMAAFSDSPGIREAGTSYLRYFVLAYPFAAVSILAGRILQGLGSGLPLLVLTGFRVILISCPLAYALVFWLDRDLRWVWIAMVVGVVITSAIATLWLRWGLGRAERAAADPTP
jgi:putative MATE family efflux protein